MSSSTEQPFSHLHCGIIQHVCEECRVIFASRLDFIADENADERAR